MGSKLGANKIMLSMDGSQFNIKETGPRALNILI